MPLCSNPYYVDSALHWICRTLPSYMWDYKNLHQLADYTIEDFDNHEVPKGLKPGHLGEQLKKNKMLIYDYITITNQTLHRSVAHLVSTKYKVRFGLRAVASVALSLIEDDRFSVVENKNDIELATNITKLGILSSQHTAKDVDLFGELYRNQVYKNMQKTFYKLRQIWKAKVASKKPLNRANLIQADMYDREPEPVVKTLDGLHLHQINGMFIVQNPYLNEVNLLTSEDLNRLDKIVTGVANTDMYYATYHTMDLPKRMNLVETSRKYVSAMLRAVKFGNYEDANKVSRCLDIKYNILLAEVGRDVDDSPYKLQLAKDKKEKCDAVLKNFNPLSLVTSLPLKHKLEIMLLYKLLPSGDYGIFGAAKRQADLYNEYQKDDHSDHSILENIKDGPIAYYKWLMIFAFYKKHNVCPGYIKEEYIFEKDPWIQRYPYCEPGDIDFRKAHYISFNGEFLWRVRGYDYLDLVKDKAVCPEEIAYIKDQNALRKMQQAQKSQLVHILKSTSLHNLEELDMNSVFLDVKADDKAEAKKERGRWFFEAGTWARLLISQYEDSVSTYASEIPGCMAGKSAAEKLSYMNDLTAPLVGSETLQRLMISFDIDKFSPGLPIIVHRQLDKLWAEAFGVPKLEEYSRILTDGKIHYIKRNIHHTIPKQSADFEGFFGRKLTMYHCAVMSYTVRLLRERGITSGPAMFAALIDDGLLSVNVPVKNFVDNVSAIKSTIETVYRQAGMRISWDKTFISCKLAVFLNDIRFYGRTIAPALKAILKVTYKSGDEVRSLPQDLQYLEGTIRGAVTSGAMMLPLYGIYIAHVVDCLNRWGMEGRRMFAAFVLKVFLPFEFGGLRLQNVITLSGSITSENIEEQLGILEIIGYRIPDLRVTINKFLSISLQEPSIQRANECQNVIIGNVKRLKTDRLQQKLTSRLEYTLQDSIIGGVFVRIRGEEGSILHRMLDNGAILPVEVRELILGSDIHAAYREIIRKFTSSRSMLSFISRKDLLSVAYVNAMEAKAFFTTHS